jgi:GR25 family glycosyltransferase involved in LPS biosynthesis
MKLKHFWINIDNSTKRREYMENQFEKLNIDNKRISAITPEDFPDVLNEEPPYFCGNSSCLENECSHCKFEYACNCSHLKAIKEGYDEGLDYFIICEDDIFLPFEIDFEKIIKQLPEDFDIFQMMVLDENANIILFNHFHNTKDIYVKFSQFLHFFSTGMYIITRNGAKKLLEKFIINSKYDFSNYNGIKQADFLLYLNTNTYTTTFPLCIPNINLLSEIHPSHFHIHKKAIMKILEIMNYNQLYPHISNFTFMKNNDEIKFYWINLEKAIERKEFMENQFNITNINNQRIIASTPKDLIDILEENPPYFCGYQECLNKKCKSCPVEFATVCSHLNAIREGYNSGNDYFVVCEDDIILDFKIDFQKIILNFPNNYEILQMMIISKSHTEFFYENMYKSNNLFVKYTPITPSAAFYLISRNGAKQIIDKYLNKETNKWNINSFDGIKVADVLIYQSVNTCVLTFPLCSFNINFKSQIHDHHFEAHNEAYEKIKEIHKDYKSNPLIIEKFTP